MFTVKEMDKKTTPPKKILDLKILCKLLLLI